ncbi:MAG: LLM class F420-dependent oxidoreductase [Pseudomonadota bacterium]
MHIGFFIFATDFSISIVELAKELEERGFESLFVPEHTHIPTSRRSPWPGGAELPREYSHTLDPFVGLAAAAAVTTKLRVGTGITLLTERDPIVTAKEVATIDLLSNGRFELGIGAGWNAEEMENHGTVFDTRFRVMVDRAKAMQAIWTQDEASYDGEFVKFDPIWSWPKPVQKPHPPIILGGETKYTLRRVVDFCDGWFPRARFGFDVGSGMAELRAIADDAGRDFKTISTTVFGAKPDAAYLDEVRTAGVDRSLIGLPPEGRDTILPLLDKYATFLK